MGNISENKTEKLYFVRRLDCANCAAKMEAKIRKLPEVEDANLTFMTGRLQVVAEDDGSLKDKLEKVCQSIESEVYLEEKGERHHDHEHAQNHHEHDHDGCCCGHDHEHDHDGCCCDDDDDDDCCCGHNHDHDHKHEHDHDGCCCDDDDDDDCCCGHDHDHEHHDHEHHHHDEHDHHHHSHEDHDTRELQHTDGMIAKTYIIQNLGCANCAAKMEAGIRKMPEVGDATLTFATKQLKIEAKDPDQIKAKIESLCQSIERDVYLEDKPQTRAAKAASNSEHAGNRKKGFFATYKGDLIPIIIGAVIFTVGMILHHVGGGHTGTMATASAGGPILDGIPALIVFGIGYLILGGSVLKKAGQNILGGQVFDENFLMSVATLAAFVIGEYPEGMGVMLFYRIGELFEHIAVERSRDQIMEAVDMRPETVLRIQNEVIEEIPAEDAEPGDIIEVRPGDRIPLDGIVTEGTSRIDTSPVTGEPVPVSAAPGSEVISGCVNENGLLKVKVTKPLQESMVTRILDSVENAAAGKPKIDRFITRFARIYTPIVVGLAVLLAILPSIITGNWMYWITTAITFLVISCPCALVISVPLAFFSGIGAGSRKGILFKGGASLEALTKIKAVIMDKTGTITEGNFKVQNIETAEGFTEDEVLQMAAACEAASTHPIAASIREEAAARSIAETKAEKIEELSGRGVRSTIEGKQILCGNARLLTENGIEVPADETKQAGTVVLMAAEGKYAGAIRISDTIKKDARTAIARIIRNGLVPVMLTGDEEKGAQAVAAETGISRVLAGLLPDGKLKALQDIRSELGGVMFVGDGINDAPVLAGADVGAAMGSGADAAIEAADVVFMNPSVEAVPDSIQIAKTTNTIAWQNVVLALGIKLIVMVLGVIGFANIWAAVFADTGVAILCILNSLRILLKKF